MQAMCLFKIGLSLQNDLKGWYKPLFNANWCVLQVSFSVPNEICPGIQLDFPNFPFQNPNLMTNNQQVLGCWS